MQLRDYQQTISTEASGLLSVFGYAYLAMQVRTGKTITALEAARLYGARDVIILTKKKAISSIEADCKHFDFNSTVINYESMHKIGNIKCDLMIVDEAHGLGAFPKPSLRAKNVAAMYLKYRFPPVILLSGTPTPESYSQIYHQLYFLGEGPFMRYSNFYKWAKDYVDVKQVWTSGMPKNDYSGAKKDKIDEVVKPFMISYTQQEAGFESKVEEEILYVDMSSRTAGIIDTLKKDFIVNGKDETIIADTGAKLMQKTHQLCSGTIIFESGNTMVIDHTKAKFIRERFSGKKIGIFYKFKAELDAIECVFGLDICTTLDEFDNCDKSIALQIQSGREGVSLKNAEYLVFYNIDFSATSYWQAKDRMTTMDRKFNKVYWVFSRGGIEEDIYKAVCSKKNYTLSYFNKYVKLSK